MLVLSRKEGQSITMILPNNQKIKVKLSKYIGQQTKVAIDAPNQVKIFRQELLQEQELELLHHA